MGTKCEDPMNIRINALRIVDDSPVDARLELQDAISDFNQAVGSAQLRGQRLVALLNDPHVVYKASEEELFKVRTNVNRITKSAQSVTGAIDRSLVEIITSRITSRGRHVDGLLEHFKAKLDEIARATLDKIDDRLESEWRIVEECYNQARDPSGSLDPGLYCFQQAKVEYYWLRLSNKPEFGNKDRSNRVPNHPLTIEQRTELDQEWKAGIRNEWNDFWIRTLSNCVLGPTLFYPVGVSPTATVHRSLEDIPQYLFRVYDSKSSGLNSATVFASDHSLVPNGAPASKVDLFSLSDDRVSDMLHHHLEKKNCFCGRGPLSNGDISDNLVSWTSSFMYASSTQYGSLMSAVPLPPMFISA
ncbi:hypothetical protein FANTH_12759 [Fusarium anthophilum]|uniref:Uncharacterized protein n=1 Tax=Fusarium anthophilum TaxID=48485 RepID=A0A8H5DRF2_9HYPO|nr:hypothetical protein FANTH_12759 [Fusarium anthophilum]